MAALSPSFFADAMLGRLARWLRILGYDVFLADNRTADEDILNALAGEPERTLLTRDRVLAQRAHFRKLPAILIFSDSLDLQIIQIRDTVSIDASRIFTRCPSCGALLETVSRDDAKSSGAVPAKSLENSTVFSRCPSCGAYYWNGTHWSKIIERVRSWGMEVKESFIKGE